MKTELRTELKTIDSPGLVELVATWLARKENAQWLDFGDGQKSVTPAWVKMVARSGRHVVRVFTADDGRPIGLVALGSIDHTFRTATLWFVLGEKEYACRGYTTRAAAEIMRSGFVEMGLHAINTWTVEGNRSVNIVRRLGFTAAGRHRQCHWIDGSARDRLLFDVLAAEFSEVVGHE